MENNLSESEKSWKETIKFLLENQGTREELMPDCDGIELSDISFPFELGKIGDDVDWQTTTPKQIDITAQEKHLNSIIDKDYEFVNKYCKKHNININELALQKNNRAITSDTHGDLFSVMVALTLSGVNFFKNCFFYFDLKNNRFITRKEAIKLIKEKIDLVNNNYNLKFINIFIEYFSEFIEIFHQKENYSELIKSLEQLINEKDKNINHQFNIIKEIYEENNEKKLILTFIDNYKNKIIMEKSIYDDSKIFVKCITEIWGEKNYTNTYGNENFNLELMKLKNGLFYKVLHSNPIYVIPIPYINPNFNGKFIDLGDSIDRGPESITCIVIYALLSQAMPNSIICLLGNHETIVQDKSLQNFIKFCIEKKALRTGYIEKAIKDGQEIYYSYSHVILQKKDLPDLFALLYIIFNIDTEKKFLQEQDIEVFTKHIKEKWPKRFSELPEELQAKVINFFDKNNLKQLDIKFNDPDDPNYIAKSHQFNDFYCFIDFFAFEYNVFFNTILKNTGFKDIDFVELRNVVGDIIYHKYYFHIRDCQKFKNYIKANCGSFMHARRGIPKTLFDNIYQHIGHDFNNFTLIPKTLNGHLIKHDVFRSIGYRKTESRVNLFISNIYANDFFIIDGFISRNGHEISKESEIIIDDSISQIILHESDDEKLYKTYGELKEYVPKIKNFINKKIDENLIKKSLTENNEIEETKIMLTQSKESWQTAINFINQKHNSETAKKESDLFEIIMNTRKNILNSLIDEIYANTYTESNDLKENSYFPLITKLIKQNIISLNKSLPALHFDLQNNEFINEEEYQSLIYKKNCESKNAILLIYIFLNKLEDFMSIYPQPYVISYFRNQTEIEANAKDIILKLKLSINKLSHKKFTIKEIKGQVIEFSDENENFINISKPNKDYQYITINSKTNFGYNYKNEIFLNLDDYFNEKRIDFDSYWQKIRDTVLNWLNSLNLTIDVIKFYFEMPIPITQSKEKFICFLKEPNNVTQKIYNKESLDKEEFIKKLIEIYDQKNKETITCFMTLALTALSNPNIKFILSNYETTFCGNEYFAKLIDYCIEEKIFINGYVEEVIEDGKQIWHSYFPAIFTKKHLQKLFAILFVLIYIDKEIQRLNYFGKELENYLKAKWPIKLKELPKESQEKLLSFFDEHNLQSLKLNTWEDFLKMDWQNFYKILIKAKFTDIEFFLLKIIICEIFHNEYYSEANQIWKLLFSAIAGKMNWLYHEEYIPQNSNETFSIIQHLGQYYENLPQNLNCFNAELIQLQKTEYNFLDDEAEYNLVSSSDDEEMDKIREEDLVTPIEIIPPLTPGDQSELSEP